MNCQAFEAWLDADRPASDNLEAERHAKGCADCAALVVAEDALSSTLRASLVAPRSDFTDRVLSRVASLAPAEAELSTDLELVTPWWLHLLREPAALLGLLLGGFWTAAASSLFGKAPDLLAALPAWHMPALVMEWSPPFVIAVALVLLASLSTGLYWLASAASSRMSGLAR